MIKNTTKGHSKTNKSNNKRTNKKKNLYITTTLPYVNSDPHLGHATEFIRADVIARYKKNLGYKIFFNTGTDEHGIKIFNSAKSNNLEIKEYVDRYSNKFKALIDLLNILPEIHFIRTTDNKHIKAAQEFWKLCKVNGYIYKKIYIAKYCSGCELEKTDSELDKFGKCAIHINREIEFINEENYFFKFSAFQKKLLNFYKKNPNFIIPYSRMTEIKSFVSRGIKDFSISRLKSKMPWGIQIPDDSEQVMYVWFDALVSYISTLGWPKNKKLFEKFWIQGTPIQYCGKDNLRQQTAIWQAMLMSVGIPNTHKIIIDGFINDSKGNKMSKSLGNVINPNDIIKEYSVDALRYFVLREIPSFEDGIFSMEIFKKAYNANLANGLGNLTARIMKMSEMFLPRIKQEDFTKNFLWPGIAGKVSKSIEAFNLKQAMDLIWEKISKLDVVIQKEKPFMLVKDISNKNIMNKNIMNKNIIKGKNIIKKLVVELFYISKLLEPFLPDTAQKIQKAIKTNKTQILFPRKE